VNATRVEDQAQRGLSRRLVQRARERIFLRDLVFVLPAIGYSMAMIGYYAIFGTFLEFLPSVFLLAAVPMIALLGSSREATRPWVPFVAVMLCYEALQGTIGSLAASRTIYSVYPLDKLLWGFNLTGWVQSTFYSSAMTLVTSFFYSLHLPLVVITSVGLWKFNRKLFSKYVAVMVITSYAALVTFIILPTAPPWYQGAAGDLFYGGTSSALPNGVLYAISIFEADKFAAFPSLHTAYAIIFSYFMIRLDRRLALVSVPITAGILFSTVYLGQHYAVDLIAGAVYALVPCLLVERFLRSRSWLSKVVPDASSREEP
jgi:membrane-associated phospholipid phosphatase